MAPIVEQDCFKYIIYTILGMLILYSLYSRTEYFRNEDVDAALLDDVEKHVADISITDEEQQKRELDYLEERRKANAELSNVDALLPDNSTPYAPDLTTANFLTAGEHIGIDTRPQTKIHNLDMFRPVPTIPRDATDQPWFNMSSFSGDIINKPLA